MHIAQFTDCFLNTFPPGHQCTVNKTYNIKPVIEEAQKDGFLWIWILGIVVLGVYGIIVTIVAIIIWVRYSSNTYKHQVKTK